jgi:hypothetical protein
MESKKTSPIKLFLTFIYILIFPAVLLFISGNLFWIQGWVFSIWFLGLCYTTIIYLYRYDPALLEERYRKPGSGEEKGWDKYFIYILLPSFIIWLVIMPLDAQRFIWTTNFPLGLESLGFVLLLGLAFFYSNHTRTTALYHPWSEYNQKEIKK